MANVIWTFKGNQARTPFLPKAESKSIYKQLRAQLVGPYAKYNLGLKLHWISQVERGENDDKVQHFKICGSASIDSGTFIFCCDMIERLGRWSRVEQAGRFRLETRIAVGKSYLEPTCADLDIALKIMAESLAISLVRDANGQDPEVEEDDWMPSWVLSQKMDDAVPRRHLDASMGPQHYAPQS